MNEVIGWLIAILVFMGAVPFMGWMSIHNFKRPRVVYSPRTEQILVILKILLGECLFGICLLPLLAGAMSGVQNLGEVLTRHFAYAWFVPGEIALLIGGVLTLAVTVTLEIRRSLLELRLPKSEPAAQTDLHDGNHMYEH